MNTFSPEVNIAIEALGIAILQSLWISAVIYLLYIIAQKFTHSAAVRYNLAAISLSAIVVSSVAAFLYRHNAGLSELVTVQETVANNVVYYTLPALATTQADVQASVNYLNIVIAALYVIGVSIMMFRLVSGLMNIQKLRKGADSSKELEALIAKLKSSLKIGNEVRLLISDKVISPVMAGIIKPVILLPVATVNQLSADQLEAILLHELAHIKRNDYLINILQTIAETLLFFNPFLWLISARMRKEREYCCDDIVLKNTASPLPYAHALTILETHRQSSLALAARGKKQHLFHRIKRIMEMKRQPQNKMQLVATLLSIVAIICCIAIISPAFAQNKKGDKNKKETTKTEKHVNTKVIITDDSVDSQDELEQAMAEVQEALEEAGADLQNIDLDLNIVIDSAMANIDWEKLDMTTATHIDSKEMAANTRMAMNEVRKALIEVDWDEIRKETNRAISESGIAIAESGKAMAEVAKSLEQLKHINMTQDERTQLDNAIEKLNSAAENLSDQNSDTAIHIKKVVRANNIHDIKNSTNSHNSHISANGVSMDGMLKGMEKEGLIDYKDGFKIEKKKNLLYINGEQQPEAVYNRYKKYLKGNRITVKGDENTLQVNVQN